MLMCNTMKQDGNLFVQLLTPPQDKGMHIYSLVSFNGFTRYKYIQPAFRNAFKKESLKPSLKIFIKTTF